MTQLKPRLILVLLTLLLDPGCSNPVRTMFAKWKTPEAHVPTGSVAEVRRATVVPVWTHDKDGKPVKAYVYAYPGMGIGPLATK